MPKDDGRTLAMYTVYDHPRDIPDKFVVREYFVRSKVIKKGAIVMTADTLEEVREAMSKRQLFCIERDPGDDPCIVETWL